MSTPATTLLDDSSPELSPRRSWRTTSHRPQEPPVLQPGRTRSASHRSRRAAASHHTRTPSTPPSRPADARGRSVPPVHTRDRSPLGSYQARPRTDTRPPAPSPPGNVPLPTRTIIQTPRDVRAPSPQRPRAPPSAGAREKSPALRTPSSRDPRARSPLAPPDYVAPLPQQPLLTQRQVTPPPAMSPQPGTSSGLRGTPFRRTLIRGSSESTLTAPSPHRDRRLRSKSPEVVFMGPPPSRRPPPPATAPQRPSLPDPVPLMQTPPRQAPEVLVLPRTPGFYSSPEDDLRLDLTRRPRAPLPETDSITEEDTQWDRFSVATEPAPIAPPPLPETPLSWVHIVDLVYKSGLIDTSALPSSPEPVRSVIGGPQTTSKTKVALPPSPLAAASLPSAMKSCWGGTWSSHAQHQPPPPNAALHPGPSAWVPEYRARFHAGPGLDLRPAKLSAREREWAGSATPPVEHSWLVDIETMARAQLAALSNLEWLFGVYLDSSPRASQVELDTVRGFIVRELQHAANFSGAQIAASTLGRRRAILDQLHRQLSQTTRNWLQLQPVGLSTQQGLFGPASALVPDIMRQQPVPRANTQPRDRRRAARPQYRREATREPPAQAAPAQPTRAPAATYTPTAAAAPAPQRAQNRPRGRGGQQPSARGARGNKQQL